MKIDVKKEGNVTFIIPKGNIDYVTAPQLDEVVESEAPNTDSLVFDLADVKYISSAGLRSILNADELMEDRGGIKLTNVNKDIESILEMTGFADVLKVE